MQTFNSATKLVAVAVRDGAGEGRGVREIEGRGGKGVYWIVKTRRYKQLALGSWQFAS